MPQPYARLARGSAAGRAADRSSDCMATTHTNLERYGRSAAHKSAVAASSQEPWILSTIHTPPTKSPQASTSLSTRYFPTVPGTSIRRGIVYHPGEGKGSTNKLLPGLTPCHPRQRSTPAEGCRGLELAGELLEAPGRPAIVMVVSPQVFPIPYERPRNGTLPAGQAGPLALLPNSRPALRCKDLR